MAQAGQGSLKPFYVVLGIIVVVGAALIARQMLGGGAPQLLLAPVAGGPPIPVGPRGVVMGSDTAKVEITEFADFECPWCARFAVMSLPDLRRDLVETGKARWRFVNFPLEGHTDSPYAHLAAACANEQGKFWQMADQIYNNQSDWVGAGGRIERKLGDLAQQAGLDMSRYDACVKNRSAWPQVQADKAFGDSVGVNSTPTFMINGRVLADIPTEDQFVKLVDSVNAAVRAPHGPAQPPSRSRR